MAYARWSTSDIYIYLDSNGYFCCCNCSLDNIDFNKFFETKTILFHIDKHIRAGHKVLNKTIMRLKEDEKENDLWIKKMMKAYGGTHGRR